MSRLKHHNIRKQFVCGPRIRTLIMVLITNVIFSNSALAQTGLWTYGLSIGFGGAGLRTYSNVDGETKKVERADGPAAFSLFADRIYNDSWTLALEHIRGYRLAPFGSGLSFTGIGFKWYFWNPAPAFVEVGPESTHVFVQQFTPYMGAASGLATGSIYRPYDKVQTVEGSGIYYGLRGGIDLLLKPGLGLRGESSLSATMTYPERPYTTVTEFSMRLGFFFFY